MSPTFHHQSEVAMTTEGVGGVEEEEGVVVEVEVTTPDHGIPMEATISTGRLP